MSTCHRPLEPMEPFQDCLCYSTGSLPFSEDTTLRKGKSVIAKSESKKSESEANSQELERVGEGTRTGCGDIAHGGLSHTY